MRKSIGFISYEWMHYTNPVQPLGSTWYRCELPRKELIKHGWISSCGMPQYTERSGFGTIDPNTKQTLFRHDIIVFKNIMDKKVLDILKQKNRKNQKILVDVDDLYEEVPKENLSWKTTRPEYNSQHNINYYEEIVEMADYITVSTKFLYDYYSNKFKKNNVFLVRNAIDIDRWNFNSNRKNKFPVLGWVGFAPYKRGDFKELVPHLSNFLDNNGLLFQHSGSSDDEDPVNKLLSLSSINNFIHQNAQPINEYPSIFNNIDIGVVPLANNSFNNAKSALKGLEYCASGIPFVASKTYEYQLIAENGIGRVANSPEEWLQHLTELLDPKIRKEEAEKNYENLKAYHSMSQRGMEWNDVMNTVLSR